MWTQGHRRLAACSVILGAFLLGVASCATGSSAGGGGGEGGSSSGNGPTTGQGSGSTASSSGAGTGGGSTGTGGASTGAQSASASSSAASSTGTGTGPINVGIACTSDAACGAGGHCILPTANDPVLSGGAAAGYCTKSCTTDADCSSLGSTCITDMNGANGECFLNCSLGPALMYLDDMLDPGKCRGREDVRCDDSSGTAVCLPSCGSSSECPAGRSCDPKYNVCVSVPSPGQPTGSSCSGGCAGNCYNFTGNVMMCSTSCVLGGPIDGNDCGGLAQGLCAFSVSGNGAGDVGVCAEACTTQAGCLNPSFWCYRINGVTGSLVNNGWCLGGTPCPNGQTDCASKPNTTCTNKNGTMYCIDTMFP